jgi:hypothetical protein
MAYARESRRTDPHVSIRAVPWHGAAPPTTVLAIRLQAMGDVVITLPYLRALQRSLPSRPPAFPFLAWRPTFHSAIMPCVFTQQPSRAVRDWTQPVDIAMCTV